MRALDLDAVILGGGIAGLWLLAALRRRGYTVVLLEAGALGAGQTIASQGIIHGGTKYALTQRLTGASEAMAEMPARWRSHLGGEAGPDLRAVEVAARHHLLWLPPRAGGGLLSFLTSKTMRSRTSPVPEAERPAPLRSGHVLALDEAVLDIASLLRALAASHAPWIRAIEGPEGVELRHSGGEIETIAVLTGGGEIVLRPRHTFLAAGAGNADLLARLGHDGGRAQQLRPLKMLMARDAPAPLWAHCVITPPNPLFTITSHRAADGALVWYIGGELAEQGVGMDDDELIARARTRIGELLADCDLSAARWAVHAVDRAEGRAKGRSGGRRPDDAVVTDFGARTTALWPTKLALAPRLADLAAARLEPPSAGDLDPAALDGLARPDVATPPWDEATAWK